MIISLFSPILATFDDTAIRGKVACKCGKVSKDYTYNYPSVY